MAVLPMFYFFTYLDLLTVPAQRLVLGICEALGIAILDKVEVKLEITVHVGQLTHKIAVSREYLVTQVMIDVKKHLSREEQTHRDFPGSLELSHAANELFINE